MRKLGLLCAMALFLLFVCACAPGPADVPAALAERFALDPEGAIAEYEGKSCCLTIDIRRIDPEGYVQADCGRGVSATVTLPKEELEEIELRDILRVEGTIKRVAQRGAEQNAPQIELAPARIAEREFTLTGEAAKIYHDWERGGQDYAVFLSDEALPGCQVSVYLPKRHGIQEGDRITVTGRLNARQEQRAAGYAPGGEGKELIFMDKPSSIQK